MYTTPTKPTAAASSATPGLKSAMKTPRTGRLTPYTVQKVQFPLCT